jgi:hypothetical protein
MVHDRFVREIHRRPLRSQPNSWRGAVSELENARRSVSLSANALSVAPKARGWAVGRRVAKLCAELPLCSIKITEIGGTLIVAQTLRAKRQIARVGTCVRRWRSNPSAVIAIAGTIATGRAAMRDTSIVDVEAPCIRRVPGVGGVFGGLVESIRSDLICGPTVSNRGVVVSASARSGE